MHSNENHSSPSQPIGGEQSATNEDEQSKEDADNLQVNESLESYNQALQSVTSTLSRLRGCPEKEREELADDISKLAEMEQKLTKGRVEIVVFGEISTGKSALINAMIGKEVASVNVQGGWTKEVWGTTWDGCGFRIKGLEQSEVVLVDTPGINEVGGVDRKRLAEDTARRADLILFVTDSDLNDSEYAALLELAAVEKPIILVFNKTDLYSQQHRNDLLDFLKQNRLKSVIPEDQFVTTVADPRPIEYVYEKADGKEEVIWKEPDVDVSQLNSMIVEILERDGKGLLALNAALFAADKSDRMNSVRVQLRRKHAQQIIWSFASFKAIVVGLTFAPLLDVLTGFTVDVMMIVALSQVYGINLSMNKARSLGFGIVKSIGWVAGVSYAMEMVSSAFKLATFGLGTALTAIPQGAAAGWSSYLVGNAAEYYFQHGGSWGEKSPKEVVKEILKRTDKDSVISKLKDEISAKMAINRHSKT